MSTIFLSYSRKNEATVGDLIRDLELLGHEVWRDRKLVGGQSWWEGILQQVHDCDLFVFALTPESLETQACRSEYEYARALEKHVLPVLLSDGVSLNLLPYDLTLIQYVDYRKRDMNAGLGFARSLNELPPLKPLPSPLPPIPELPISNLAKSTGKIRDPGGLSYEQQSTLLLDLDHGLDEPAMREDALLLLSELRKRHDVLGIVAGKIDALIVGEGVVRDEEAAGDAGAYTAAGSSAGHLADKERSGTEMDSGFGVSEAAKPGTPRSEGASKWAPRKRKTPAVIGAVSSTVYFVIVALIIFEVERWGFEEWYAILIFPAVFGCLIGYLVGDSQARLRTTLLSGGMIIAAIPFFSSNWDVVLVIFVPLAVLLGSLAGAFWDYSLRKG